MSFKKNYITQEFAETELLKENASASIEKEKNALAKYLTAAKRGIVFVVIGLSFVAAKKLGLIDTAIEAFKGFSSSGKKTEETMKVIPRNEDIDWKTIEYEASLGETGSNEYIKSMRSRWFRKLPVKDKYHNTSDYHLLTADSSGKTVLRDLCWHINTGNRYIKGDWGEKILVKENTFIVRGNPGKGKNGKIEAWRRWGPGGWLPIINEEEEFSQMFGDEVERNIYEPRDFEKVPEEYLINIPDYLKDRLSKQVASRVPAR